MSARASVAGSSDFRWLLVRTRPFIGRHAASQACVIGATTAALLEPLLMKWLVDDVLPMRRMSMLPVVAAALVALYLVRRALEAASALLSMQAVMRMLFAIRIRLLRHLHTLPAAYYDRQPAGDLLHRLEQDVSNVGSLGGDLVPLVARLVTTAVAVLAAMFLLDATLSATVLPLVPLFVLLRWRVRAHLRTRADDAQARAARVSTFLQEHLPAIVQIQLLRAEPARTRQFAHLAAASARADVARRRAELLFGSLLSLVVFLGMATVLGVGGYRVMTGHLTVGSLVAFYGYTLQLFIPFYSVVDLAARFERVAASVRRIRAVEDAYPTVVPTAQARPVRREAADIRFEGVSFGYGNGTRLLHDVSFHVGAGERIGLMGRSGSGKSSIGKLMVRLYDANAGAILIARQDIRRVPPRDVRNVVALVPQEARLFDGTLIDNVRCGLPRCDLRDLEAAAAAAQLHGVLERLPRGWHEPLGPEGRCLSGGERQRVALARAILRRPAVLVLDEVTAGLDAATERALLAGLIEYVPDATLVVISHRRAALSCVERVLRIEKGRLVPCDVRLAG